MSNSNSSFRVAFGVFLALFLAAGEGRADPFEGRKIERVEVRTSDADIRAPMEELFRSEIGDVYSSEKISAAIRKAYSGRSVYQVRAYAALSGEGVVVRIEVDPKPTVDSIEFSGNASLSSEDLETRMNITVGDSITPEALEECGKRLGEYYVARGFGASAVHVESEKTEGTRARVRVKVDEGAPCLLDRVDLEIAKPVLSSGEAAKLLGVRPGDRCDSEEIRRGVKRISDRLRQEERLAASSPDPILEFNDKKDRAKLTVRIDPGPVIRVRILGNTFVFERNSVLEKAAALDEERQFTKGWVEGTAVEGITSFYLSKGYPDVAVTVEDKTDESAGLRTITFHVQRGRKLWLTDVTFKGNKVLNKGDLKDAFFASATEPIQNGDYVAADLDSGAAGVLALYQSKGYLRADVGPPAVRIDKARREAKAAFEIREGDPTVLSEYRISGNRLFDSATIADWMKVKPGEPLDPARLAKAADGIEDRYHAKGYKFASVRIPKIEDLSTGRVAYDVTVHEGNVVQFGQVIIRGNLHTNDVVIRRKVKVKEGDRYNPEAIRETRRRVSQLGFFNQIGIEEVNYDPTTGREDVVITVVERKKRSVRLRPGYSTEKGARMAADFAYINIAGTGRSASISSEISRRLTGSDITEYRVVGTFIEPSVLNLATGRVNVINERQNEITFDIDRTSLILGLDREWEKWLRTTLQWQLEFRNPFNVRPGVTLSPFDQDSARFGSLGAILDFDFRNDFLSPTKGTYHQLRFSFYDRTLGSQAEFWQAYSRNTFYVPIYKRIRIVSGIRAGLSSTFGSTRAAGIEDVPIEKRFRLGGAASLRGFSRNCVGGLPSNVPEDCSSSVLEQAPGGNALFNYMTDLLLPITRSFDFAFFTDGGNAFPLNRDFSFTDIRTSAGVGLRYNAFFGTVRLDVGFKLDRRPGESLVGFDFAVGQF
jgi:outer membrane protein insertion porin family